MNSLLFETQADAAWDRVDICAAEEFELFSRSQYKHRVLRTSVNGQVVKPSRSVQKGDYVVVEYLPEKTISLEPQDIELSILFENEDCLVVNKARGMVVHPGAGNPDSTLVNAFLFHCGDGPGENFRPGIVHRLDKDTSGVIILAKSAEALEFLSRQFRERKTVKQYLAILDGSVSPRGEVGGCIQRSKSNRKTFVWDAKKGKEAKTQYTLLSKVEDFSDSKSRGDLSLVKFLPVTGRTHQLRVHGVKLGAPIHGDPLYNKRKSDRPLMLHAHSLRIMLPSESSPRTFTAEIPNDMRDFLKETGLELGLVLEEDA